MKTVEELFKKVNNDKIELNDHKEKLKKTLLNSRYFTDEAKEAWDWKLSLASLAFSAILIIIASSGNYGMATNNSNIAGANQDSAFYSKLASSRNVSSVSSGSNDNALQMVEDGTKTVFYFNDRNVLVHSEVINNK